MRYLSWGGRPDGRTPADVAAVQARARNDMIPRRIAPTQGPTLALSRPYVQAAPQTRLASRGLTPASAWLAPQPTPAYAPGAPDPIAYVAPEAQPQPAPSVAAWSPTPGQASVPTRIEPQPDFRGQAQPLDTISEQAPEAAADPMAPRRDAPIFRLSSAGAAMTAPAETGQAAPQTQVAAGPAQQGQQYSRYYSVHRAAGRQPDRAVLPEPVFFDSVALDLAQPPETEMPVRDAQGRRRTVVANDDPSLP